MKKNLFIIFVLFLSLMSVGIKKISAKELSILCEYNITDKNVKLSFRLYSKNSDKDDVKVKDAWFTKKGYLMPAIVYTNVKRYWKSDKNDKGDKVQGYSDSGKEHWADFDSRKSCNKYAVYDESTNTFILFDDDSKNRAKDDIKSNKIYSVKQTNNYKYSEDSPLKQEFVGQLTCGNSSNDVEVVRFHKSLPTFTSRMYDFIKILTPVIIIITGMLDIVKAVTAQKEDEMKKAQKKFLNRLLAGSVVFLVFVIVELAINFVAETDVNDAMDCVNCFLNGTMGNGGCVERTS